MSAMASLRGDRPMDDAATLHELLDRRAIEDTLIRYANALDTHRPERIAEVFSADAQLDYTAAGGIVGGWPELRAWLVSAMSSFTGWQHLLSNMAVELQGDEARARTECYNPLLRADGSVLHVGCAYIDRLRRLPQGWRITERRLEVVWMDPPQEPSSG
jgi:hypothetical protein